MAKKKSKSKSNAQPKPLSDKRFIKEKARDLPLYKCYVCEGWQDGGLAFVIVSRRRKDGNLCAGMFLCDTWCLGVKDVYGAAKLSISDFESNFFTNSVKFEECDYALAHNIIYGSEAFAAEVDIDSHPDFDLWRNILEEDTEDSPFIDLEFGHNGKYHLVASPGSREVRYAPMLKARLGDQFIFELNDDPYDDDDYYEEVFDDSSDSDTMGEMLNNMTNGWEFFQNEKARLPDEVYAYDHPAYPSKLHLKNEFLEELFSNPDYSLGLPQEMIDRIMALPQDELIRDLSAIILYKIGQTWEAIDNGTAEEVQDSSLLHSLAFIGQLGRGEGLDAVMEVMRQNDDFLQYHLGDADAMVLPGVIYATARHRTAVLEEFLRHPGFNYFSKYFVGEALRLIAKREPERRDEIIEIFRRYLNFMQENIPTQNGCSGNVAAFIINVLIDMKATELLPEIKSLHEKEYVNLTQYGNYDDALRYMNDESFSDRLFEFSSVQQLYSHLRECFEDKE